MIQHENTCPDFHLVSQKGASAIAEKEIEICNLYRLCNVKQISNETGVPQAIISRILRKNNVEIFKSHKTDKFNIEDVKQYFLQNTLENTAKKFNCSGPTMAKFLLEHQISKPHKIINIQNIINDYQMGQTLQTIGENNNISFSYVSLLLNKYNIKTRTNKDYRKYILKTDFFEKIDTYEKAAILGFLYADGYNNQKNGKIRIGIHKQDIDYLEKINAAIQPDKKNSIRFTYSPSFKNKNERNNKNIAYTVIFCQKMCDDLAKIGCIQAKSLIVEFPKIKNKFLSSFMAGYFDGDGCLSFSTPKTRRKRNYCVRICVSDIFAIIAKQKIEKVLKINVTIRKDGKISVLIIAGNRNVEKFMDWIYSKTPMKLNRKYEKFLDMKKYFKEYVCQRHHKNLK